MAVSPFTFTDGERLIRFGTGVLGEAPALLAERGFDGYVLLTTERARAVAPALAEGAASVLHVPGGGVPEAADAVRDGVEGRPMVALGGGRVVDSAKAIAGADRLSCAAVPTTLAGSPFTPFHRMPAGVDDWRLVRPSLVVADPALMASAPGPQLVATGMNALAHAMEALYTPRANPVAELAALRASALLGAELPRVGRGDGAAELALGAVLGGYAVGTTGLALHHAVCQTIVRTCGSPHAETNAVMLPHSARLMAGRAPREMGEFARALGAGAADPAGAPAAADATAPPADPASAGDLVAALTALSGTTRLSQLGVTESAMEEVASAAAQHPAVQATPGGGVDQEELRELLHHAL